MIGRGRAERQFSSAHTGGDLSLPDTVKGQIEPLLFPMADVEISADRTDPAVGEGRAPRRPPRTSTHERPRPRRPAPTPTAGAGRAPPVPRTRDHTRLMDRIEHEESVSRGRAPVRPGAGSLACRRPPTAPLHQGHPPVPRAHRGPGGRDRRPGPGPSLAHRDHRLGRGRRSLAPASGRQLRRAVGTGRARTGRSGLARRADGRPGLGGSQVRVARHIRRAHSLRWVPPPWTANRPAASSCWPPGGSTRWTPTSPATSPSSSWRSSSRWPWSWWCSAPTGSRP